LAVWSDGDAFNYNCILVSKKPPRKWVDYWPKRVGDDIRIKVHQYD